MNRILLLILAATLLALPACQLKKSKSKPTPATVAAGTEQQVDWLFVQAATSGTFDGETLVLHNVGPTLMFSDRPYRLHGHLDTDEYIDDWSEGDDSFDNDPPNAVLSIFTGEMPTNATVLLHAPTRQGSTLTYPISVEDGRIPNMFGSASLFIDYYRGGRRGGAVVVHNNSWHPPVGAFVAGAVVGGAVARASHPTTTTVVAAPAPVVVTQPTYVYQAAPPAPAPAAASASKPPEQQLEELKSMLDKGLITQTQYNEKQQQILAQM